MKKNIKLISVFLLAFIINISLVSAGGFSNNETTTVCGIELSKRIPGFTSGIYNIVKIVVPILLVVMGMVDFAKATMASDEKKMSEAKSTFIRRFIAAVMVFMIMAVVQFVFSKIETGESKGFANCIDCLLSNSSGACESGNKVKKCGDYDFKSCPYKDEAGNLCKPETKNGSEGTCKTRIIATCKDLKYSECTGEIAERMSCVQDNGTCRHTCETMNSGDCLKHSDICAYTKYEGSGQTAASCHKK